MSLTDDQHDRLTQLHHVQRELTSCELAEVAQMRHDAAGDDLAKVVALERAQDRLRRRPTSKPRWRRRTA